MLEVKTLCSAKHGKRWAVQLLHVPTPDGSWIYHVQTVEKGKEKIDKFSFKAPAAWEFYQAASGLIMKDHQEGFLMKNLAEKMLNDLSDTVNSSL